MSYTNKGNIPNRLQKSNEPESVIVQSWVCRGLYCLSLSSITVYSISGPIQMSTLTKTLASIHVKPVRAQACPTPTLCGTALQPTLLTNNLYCSGAMIKMGKAEKAGKN